MTTQNIQRLAELTTQLANTLMTAVICADEIRTTVQADISHLHNGHDADMAIRLVENGEDRLIQGVEQGVFPISFAILVAQSDETGIQNVLMDAFDQGIVNCENFARARTIINSRSDRRKKGEREAKSAYTVGQPRRRRVPAPSLVPSRAANAR